MKNVDEIIKQMTNKEKYKLLMGDGFWAFNSYNKDLKEVTCTDGPSGVRKAIKVKNKENADLVDLMHSKIATTFPSGCCFANSYDKNLMIKLGEALANECKFYKVNILLGPAINIKRNPLCGRNFEYLSEDPYLSGIMGGYYIKGVEDNGVGTSLKHYCCNNQEFGRQINSSNLSMRALKDTYIKPFNIAVKIGNPATIMCSYNRINGVFASENKLILNNILRDEIGFKGVVISDWGAVSNRFEGIEAGMDIEMPEKEYNHEFYEKGFSEGKFNIDSLNKSVKRIVQMENKYSKEFNVKNYDFKFGYNVAKEIALSSIVLAKNNDNFFPLDSKKEVVFAGDFVKNCRFIGGGSSHTNSAITKSFLEILDEKKANYKYFEVFNKNSESDKIEFLNYIKNKKVVLFLGLYESEESEGFDRPTMNLNDFQIELVNEVYKYTHDIAIVIESGSVVELPFLDKVKAVFLPYFAGEAENEALFELMYGLKNPSGKLSETWIKKYNDNPSSKTFGKDVYNTYYDEDIFVGYKYYEKNNIEVNFPFGFGLSYSNFKLSNSLINQNDNEIDINVKAKNISNIDGNIVVECYVKNNNSNTYRANKELCSFEKCYLKAGETKEICLKVNKEDLYIYDCVSKREVLEKGEYEFLIGQSSIDNFITVKAYINGVDIQNQKIEKITRNTTPSKKYDDNTLLFEVIGTKCFKKLLKEKHLDEMLSSDNGLIKGLLYNPLRVMCSINLITYQECEKLVEDIKNEMSE
ncbi:MAG: glycoside hydrolase family 3 N-terminal domain-containing protein [Bacilli bacterium]